MQLFEVYDIFNRDQYLQFFRTTQSILLLTDLALRDSALRDSTAPRAGVCAPSRRAPYCGPDLTGNNHNSFAVEQVVVALTHCCRIQLRDSYEKRLVGGKLHAGATAVVAEVA